MAHIFKKSVVIIGLAAGLFFFSFGVNKFFTYPYPPFNTIPQSSHFLLDFANLMMGMRRVAADIAWVQLVQYTARGDMSKEEELSIEYSKLIKKESRTRHVPDYKYLSDNEYKNIFEKTMRIVQLDPHMTYAYLFSSGVLAWNLKRYDEAYEILQLGIKNNPSYWRFSQYLAAIVYKEQGNVSKMVELLAQIVKYEDCPNLVKSTLANYFKKTGQYYKSLRLWFEIYDSNDESYQHRSLEQIELLKKKLNIKG